MSGAPSLLLRPDSREGVGSGHVARCHALAEAWVARGGAATVWSEPLRAPWPQRFQALDVEVTDIVGDTRFDWAAVDGYDVGAAEADRVRGLAGRVLRVDDHGLAGAHAADLIVDQNFGADRDRYDHGVDVLIGPRYALLRAEFARARPMAPTVPDEAGRIIYLAGGAPSSALVQLVDAVRAQLGAVGLMEVGVLDQQAVAASMASADIALTAAGSTLLELCVLAVPAVVVVVADNQRLGAEAVDVAGVAVNAGELAAIAAPDVADLVASLARDAGARARMATAGWKAVDGRGAARVVTRMRGRLLAVRNATVGDAARLLDWRNDEATRRASFTPDRVAGTEHAAWLDRVLADDAARLFIVEEGEGRAVAQVRFDMAADGRAEISVGVAPEARGRGLGAAAIDAAMEHLFATTTVDEVIARIKPDNEASISSFSNADFDARGRDSTGGHDALLYSRSRDAVRA